MNGRFAIGENRLVSVVEIPGYPLRWHRECKAGEQMILGRISNAFVLTALLLLGGCAVGNTVDYQAAAPTLDVDSDRDVVVAVLDQRPYILDGDKEPDFVGLRRGGFGNPFDVTTRSGVPFADDMAATIVEALIAADVPARSVSVPPSNDIETAVDAAVSAGGERSLVVLIGDWKADAYFGLDLDYILSAQVFDSAGALLASNDINGTNDLGVVTFESDYSKAVAEAYDQRIEELLNAPAILTALE